MVKEKVIWSLSSLSFAEFLCLFFKHSGHTNIYMIISFLFICIYACMCVCEVGIEWLLIFLSLINEQMKDPLKQKLVVEEDASPRHQATLLGPPISLILFSLVISFLFRIYDFYASSKKKFNNKSFFETLFFLKHCLI